MSELTKVAGARFTLPEIENLKRRATSLGLGSISDLIRLRCKDDAAFGGSGDDPRVGGRTGAVDGGDDAKVLHHMTMPDDGEAVGPPGCPQCRETSMLLRRNNERLAMVLRNATLDGERADPIHFTPFAVGPTQP